MARLSQGMICWADLPEPAGRRPVLILTRTDALPRLDHATVAPLTRTIRGIPSEVALSPQADGVKTSCAASLDNIITIPTALLAERIAPGTVAWLLSPDARGVTGQAIDQNGGAWVG